MFEGEELEVADRSPIMERYAAKLRAAALAAEIVGGGIFAIALVSGLLYEQPQRARDRSVFRKSAVPWILAAGCSISAAPARGGPP